MKQFYKIFAIILGVAYSASAFAQVRTVTFTGRDRTDQYRIQLHHVTVFNLDQLWEEVLYYPDTTLVLGTVGIEDHELNSGLQLMQNVPNPFNGTTEFALAMQEAGEVQLEIYDITGKLAVAKRFSNLEAGTHLFRAALSSPQTYLLSAKANKNHFTIKMVNEGYAAGNSIQHLGMMNADGDFSLYLDDDKFSSDYPFNVGDEMKYTGYALIDGVMQESSSHIGRQTNNETIPLQFDVTVPTVAITSVGGVTGTSASIVCNVSASGGSSVSKRGVCWSTSQNPTVGNSHTTDGSGTGSFTSNITGLSVGTTYYVRAYATNGVGTVYGTQRSIRTASLPTVTTSTVTNITMSSAACGGDVISDGGSSVTARGVCWSTSQNPTISDSHTSDGGGTGVFTSNLTGLVANTIYHVRAYATNSVGTAYGGQKSFMTNLCPTIDIRPINTVGLQEPLCPTYGHFDVVAVDSLTGEAIPNLTYMWSGEGVDYTSTNNQSFIAINPYMCNRYYLITMHATDTISGCAFSDSYLVDVRDTQPPVFNGTLPNGYVSPSANGNYYIPDFSAYFTNQTVSDNCYPFSQLTVAQNPAAGTIFNGNTVVTVTLTDRCGNASSHSINAIPNPSSQTCPGTPTVTDYDGNVYHTVQIGNQCWMKENLRTTHYSDGTFISLGGNSSSYTIAYRYCPNNSSSNVATYGYLYNRKAVMRIAPSSSANPSGVQGICPVGWHVPSDAEWTQLTDYVSNHYFCGGDSLWIAKSLAATTGWNESTYEGACRVGTAQSTNNATGFTAFPAGSYGSSTGYGSFGSLACFISSTEYEYNSNYTYTRYIYYNSYIVSREHSFMSNGWSVRCVRD